MGIALSTNPVADGDSRHQHLVDRFFSDNSRHWKEVYTQRTLSAAIYRNRRAVVLAMIDKLQLPGSARVLEVGCGGGMMSVVMARRGYNVTTMDTVDSMARLTQETVAEAGLEKKIRICRGDIQKLQFAPACFSLVISIGVLPWIDHPEAAIAEMARVCIPGGYVIVTSDNRWRLNHVLDPACFPSLRPIRQRVSNELERIRLWSFQGPRMHWHSIYEIDGLIAKSGLRKLESGTAGFGPFTLFRKTLFPDSIGIALHRKFQSLADRGVPGFRRAGSAYIVTAQKPQAA